MHGRAMACIGNNVIFVIGQNATSSTRIFVIFDSARPPMGIGMKEMDPNSSIQDRFSTLRCCVLIPTYNNGKTLEKVIRDVLAYTSDVIVINDGATDNTSAILSGFPELQIITHPVNTGKGTALRDGFVYARSKGYRYAIAIDSDGQHFPSDFHLFLDQVEASPDSLIIGARNMATENVPAKSSFGNKFSNFWFRVETGLNMPDTQSGFRLYPIERMQQLKFFTRRFEFEIEVIVKAAWDGIPVCSVPVHVYYAKGEERVSHFRPGKDFTRISFLNTWLVFLAAIWYRPVMMLRKLSPANLRSEFRNIFKDPNESPLRKSASLAVGIFFGIVPIWGFQLVAAIFFALLLRLNKAIVIVAANISLPPMIPIILYLSVKTGEIVTGKSLKLNFSELSVRVLKDNAENFLVYAIGATALSILLALLSGLFAYFLLNLSARRKTAALRP